MVTPDVRDDLAIVRVEELDAAAAEDVEQLAQANQVAHPMQERRGVVLLSLDVHGPVPVDGIGNHRAIQPFGRGGRKSGVVGCAPLHRRAHAVTIAELDVVSHTDLIAVIDNRRAGQRKQQCRQELDSAPVVGQQRRQPSSDPDVQSRLGIRGIRQIHVVALFLGHHLERQFVVVAQEQGPLTGVGNLRRAREHLGDGKAVLLMDRHEQAGHQRKVIRHVALVRVAEVGPDLRRPLVCLSQEHAIGVVAIDVLANRPNHRVRFREILARGAVTLDQVGHGIQPQPVHAHAEPVIDDAQDLAEHSGIVVVEIRLVREEPVPVIGVRLGVPRPVGRLGVNEDDAHAGVLLGRVTPHVIVAFRRAGRCAPRALKPRMLIGGVIERELDDDLHAAIVRRRQEGLEIVQRAVVRVDAPIVGHVVTVVAQR